MAHSIIDVDQRPEPKVWIALSFQHVFAMFGATVLVPLLTGLSPAAALFTSGIGTLLYILITGGKMPAYLGSSFAFIAPIVTITASFGLAYAMGGTIVAGLFYVLVAFIIFKTGTGWLDKVLPPVVIGSVIMVIGLTLAPVAMNMAMYPSADPANGYNISYVVIAGVTLVIAIFSSIVLKGFFTVIPVLVGIIGGYLFTFVMGLFFPSYHLIDFKVVADAAWFGFPGIVVPKFSLMPVLTFVLVSFATIAEHLGHVIVTNKVVGRDFFKSPGIHRTLTGDGLATSLAAVFGGPPNTTYGENIGVMAITRVYSVWVMGGAAVIALVLSLVQKFGALVQTMPTPVMGGISMMLFGIIASSGIRTVVESGVDYSDKRNLTITSVVLVVGIGGGKLFFPIAGGLSFELANVALATLIGILLNLVLPKTIDVDPDGKNGKEGK